MFLRYYTHTCIVYKFKNNRCGQKLIHKSLKNFKKYEMFINYKR